VGDAMAASSLSVMVSVKLGTVRFFGTFPVGHAVAGPGPAAGQGQLPYQLCELPLPSAGLAAPTAWPRFRQMVTGLP
jgi:hypothetical protein